MPYITVKNQATAELTEKRSRFIANVYPVSSEKDALDIIAKLKKEYWDARHNVYAYIIRQGNICRYTDDGEPSGTAGVPVLDVMRKQGIVDCLVVVTRYFGGVLLGTGGLVRAYSGAAIDGLRAAQVITMRPCTICEINCDYPDYDNVIRTLENGKCSVENTDFAEKVTISFAIEATLLENIKEKLKETFCGRILVKEIGSRYANID